MAQANIKAVITAEDRASGVLKGFSNNVGGAAKNIASVAATAAAAFATAGAAATTFAVKSAADFQQTRIGLENMLGGADKARAVLSEVSDFAAKTPFEFPELAGSVKQLIAFGFGADDAIKTMKQLGDVSAAVGAPIGDLSYLMGTLRTQGRAFTIDIRQFAQRGIPIYEYLGKVLKTDEKNLTGMIEAGKVGFPEVQKAFEMMTSAGGKFHGTMDKQSKSLTGLFSTLKDNIGATARELVGINEAGDVKEGSVFDRLQKGAAALIKELERLPQHIENAKRLIKEIGEALRPAVEYLGPKFESLVDVIANRLYPSLQKFYNDVIVPIAPAIGTVLVGALGLLVDGIRRTSENVTRVLDFFRELFNFITVTLPQGIETGINFVVSKVVWLKDNIGSVIGEIIGFVLTLPIKMPIYMAMAVAGMVQAVADVNWINVFTKVGEGLIAAISWAKDRFVDFVRFMRDMNWGDLFKGIYKSINNTILDLIEGALRGAFKGLPGGVGDKIKLPRFNQGVENFQGGLAYVHKGEVLANLPKGTDVIPRDKVNRGGSNQIINISVNAQAFMGTQMEARKFATMIMDAYKEASGAKGIA